MGSPAPNREYLRQAGLSNLRLISRLDIKGPNLIKGVHLEGLRVVGDPYEYARQYYETGADELIYIDVVASLYGRNNLSDIISRAARDVFVPITVGGGIRTTADVKQILRSGADKVAINTTAITNPKLITDVARQFGGQCMVLSVEAKRVSTGGWEAFTDNGREKTGLDVVDWVIQGVERGAGEVLLTSVDQEGTRKGFDVDLAKAVAAAVPVPVIISGGMGITEHLLDVADRGGVDGIAMADVLHWGRMTLPEIRHSAAAADLHVRHV